MVVAKPLPLPALKKKEFKDETDYPTSGLDAIKIAAFGAPKPKKVGGLLSGAPSKPTTSIEEPAKP